MRLGLLNSNFMCRVNAMDKKTEQTQVELISVRLNAVITGEPARWLSDWKRLGIVKSNPDAVRQAFRSFHDKLLESEEKVLAIQREKVHAVSIG